MGILETDTIVALAALVVLFIFIIFRLEPRIPIAVCLGLLVGCAVTVAIGKGAVANQIAVYAYYSLVAGVILICVQQARGVPAGKTRRAHWRRLFARRQTATETEHQDDV